jgi:UDP-N-acetylmuramate dehydrogenase
VTPLEQVPLAPFCTLGVGGPARYFLEATDETAVHEALAWADRRRLAVRVLGGGSNVVVDDAGVEGLVVRLAVRGIGERIRTGAVEITAAAGEPWDGLVRHTVDRGWAGLECLSGIPGLVGATPIQNVGAYGQEVSDTVMEVRAVDRDAGFGYRDSRFKRDAGGRWIVLSVTYRLVPGGAATVRYAELERDLRARGIRDPSLADVRESVLRVRRSKSMVLDPEDPNRRSCGSFFVNPVISAAEARAVARCAGDPAMPSWLQTDGRVKLSAAWLIEHAGFGKGYTVGTVGLSTRHALAIVAHDGARAHEVLGFARQLRDVVERRFGVRLVPEPVFWGRAPGW